MQDGNTRRRFRLPVGKRRRNRVQVLVVDHTYEVLCTLADQEEVSMSNFVRTILDEYVRRSAS